MIAVTGLRTSIIRELSRIAKCPITRIEADLADMNCDFKIPEGATDFVLAAGLLYQAPISQQTTGDIVRSLAVNMVNVIRLCEKILNSIDNAKICVVGSESGFSWSYDDTYAAAKAGVHRYVMRKIVSTNQVLFAVAPTIISDSGMTMRRNDFPEVLNKRTTVTSLRVASVIYAHLFREENRRSNFVDRILC